MRALAAALVLAATPAPRDPLDARREAIAREIVRVGEAIRREVTAADVEAIASRVPADGLRCGDRLVPRKRVVRDLRTPASWMHGVLFGGPGYSPRAGEAASLRDFFRRAGDVAYAVAFVPDDAAGPVGRPCLEFRARGPSAPPFPLCFAARNGRWIFTESLYPCG